MAYHGDYESPFGDYLDLPIADDFLNYAYDSDHEVDPVTSPLASGPVFNEGAEDDESMTSKEKEGAIRRIVAAMKDCSDVDELETAQAVVRIRSGDYYPESAYRQVAIEALVSFRL